jgi:carboxymethylenebutenolidase
VRLFLYPGQGHAFFNDTRPEAYDEDAARQAWVRTLEFLRAKLG